METIRNVTQLLIAKDISATAGDGDVINSYADLADGEVVLCTPQNVVTDGTDPFLQVKFIQRSGTKLVHSDIIDVDKILAYNIGTAAAETQQLDYVGWNGVAGALDKVAQNIYTIRLYYQESLIAGFMQQKIKEGFYKSNAVAASYDESAIAVGLVNSLYKNYSREAEKDIVASAITSDAGTNTAGTISVTKGSQYITASADALVVGEGIRLGTALTDSVYIITEVDGTVAKVSTPVVEETQVFLAAAADFAVATSGAWGVKLQGVDRLFSLGKFASRVARWVTTIDFGDSSVAPVTTTAAYPGSGTGQQISTLELELQADEFIYRGFDEGKGADRADAVQTNTADYDVCVIEHKHNLQAPQGTPTESAKSLNVAVAAGAAQGATVVGYWEALLTLMGVAYVSQAANLT